MTECGGVIICSTLSIVWTKELCKICNGEQLTEATTGENYGER